MRKGKVLSLLLVLVMVLSVFTFFSPLTQAATNLVSNPGFESGMTGWAVWSDASAVTGNAHSGTYSVQVGTASGSGCESEISGMSTSKTYTLKAWAKLSTTDATAGVGILFKNSSGGIIQTNDFNVTETSYSQGTVNNIVPPAEFAYAAVYVEKSNATGYVYVDDFELYEEDSAIKIEAENYSSMSGIDTQSGGTGTVIGSCDSEDWVCYSNVNLGAGCSTFTSSLATPVTGVQVEIRLDSTTGTLVGTLDVASTGGWFVYQEQSAALTGANGTHDIYILFKNYASNHDYFIFNNSTVPTPTLSPTPTPTPVPTPISTPRERPGNIYYVRTTGNDNNSGRSNATAWRTIGKACDTVTAGDTVIISGGIYNERVSVANSGTPSAYITFRNKAGSTPIIDGTGLTGFNDGLFNIIGKSYITVIGLKAQNSDNIGFLARGPDCSYIKFTGCKTYNTKSCGICGDGNSDGYGLSDFIVENCVIDWANNGGFWENLTLTGGVQNFTVRNNEVKNGQKQVGGGMAEGIDCKNGCKDGEIYGNYVHDINQGTGIYIDAWDRECRNIKIYNNEINNVNQYGIDIGAEAGGTVDNIEVYNNFISNSEADGIYIDDYGNPLGPKNNIKIVQNTIYHCAYNSGWAGGGGISASDPYATNVLIQNNIVSDNAYWQIYVRNPANVTVSYNCIQGYRGYAGETKGTDYVEGDPMFVSTSKPDLHIRRGSMARDFGTTTGYNTDIDGDSRPIGPAYDMGADEYLIKPGVE